MAKAKISVTVEKALVEECDRQARGGNRSEVVESALTAWLRERRRRRLEEEIERYYASLPARERREGARWAELASRSLGDVWK
jgi:metal-responsive CopG/Arc/MetJ family transcriptional regulator